MSDEQQQDEFNYVANLLLKNVKKAKRKTFEQRSNKKDQENLDQIEDQLQNL